MTHYPLLSALLLCGAFPCHAKALDLPQPATATLERSEALGSYALPIGAFKDGSIPTLNTEGTLEETAWRVGDASMTTLQLLVPLRAQLAGQGFETLFECETAACGGFDFRYGISVLPEPAMHVDLGDFRFLSARREGPGGAEHISLLVSRSSGGGYVQITRIGPAAALAVPVAVATTPKPVVSTSAAPDTADLGAILVAEGHVVLEGLQFASSAATLTETDLPALDELAAWLTANPQARVVLVGHTDASGALEGNVTLSRARAQAVRKVLIDKLGVPAVQVAAEGVGYLSPRGSNLTEEGRQKNRRVEAVLTSTQQVQ